MRFIILSIIILLLSYYFIGPELFNIIYALFRSAIRIFIAYFLSIILGIIVAILITHNKIAKMIMFPILDIMQSLPVLTFMPLSILLFIHYFPFKELGLEIVAIILTMSASAWAVIYAFTEGMSKIKKEIIDVAKLMELKGLKYIRHILLPASLAPLISSSTTSIGGAWYFIIAAEYLSFGREKYILPGIGSYLVEKAIEGNLYLLGFGVLMLILVIIFMQKYIWSKIIDIERKKSKIIEFFEKIYTKIFDMLEYISAKTKIDVPIGPNDLVPVEVQTPIALPLIVALVLILLILWFRYDLISLLISSIKTTIRIGIAFILSLAWTLGITIYVHENKKLRDIIKILMDILQSVPAVSLFPAAILIFVNLFGDLGLEIAAIFLLMTGMEWYLAFNLVRGVELMNKEYIDVAKSFSLSLKDKIKHIIYPYLRPIILFAGIQAIGGGWNAIIVSEYLIYNGKIFYVDGLGSLLNIYADKGDMIGFVIVVLTIIFIISFTNVFVWQRLLSEELKRDSHDA